MRIGQSVLTKRHGKIIKCKVIKIMYEEVKLKYGDETFLRKYWEVRKVPKNWEE